MLTPRLLLGRKKRFNFLSWNENSETGDPDVFVTLFDTEAVANETGNGGGLSGANLVWTQVNNVPAADGSPLMRPCDATQSHYFQSADTVHNLLSGSAWTVILHLKNLGATGSAGGNDFVFDDGANRPRFYDLNAMSSFLCEMGGTEYTFDTTPLTNTDVWLVMQRGAGDTWAGWKTTKPVSKSDMSTKTHSAAWSPGAGAGSSYICSASGGGNYLGARIRSVILASRALLPET